MQSNYDSGIKNIVSDVVTKIGEGSMADILKVQIGDTGVSLVYKVSKDQKYDQYLKNEYQALCTLNVGGGVPTSIPLVYGESNHNGRYSFKEEDLTNFAPLFDSNGKRLDQPIYSSSIFIMGLIGQGLKYANDKGILNNDVQLQNSLCLRGDEDVKIVDWGNTKPITPENQMTDIKQFAGIIPKIFWHNDLVPSEVKKWIIDINNKKYGSHTDAWNAFTEAYKESWNSPDYKKNENELKEYGPLMK